MKIQQTKIIALFILVLLSSEAESQFLIGGSASYNNTTYTLGNDERKDNGHSFSPQIGITVKPMHLMGFRYTYSKSKIESTGEMSESLTHGYSIFSRHRKSLGKMFNLYGEFAITHNNTQNETMPISGGIFNIFTNNDFRISLVPGLEFKFAEKWLLNAQWGILSYTHTQRENRDSLIEKRNALNASLQTESIVIGINYLFNLKEEPKS